MIIQEFNNGWGQEHVWKQFEISVTDRMIRSLIDDPSHTVIINSVWYTADYHTEVMRWLRNNHWDQIVLVAMLDAAIPQPVWYTEFERPVMAIGYYPGINELDLCAMFVHERMDPKIYGDLTDPAGIDTAFMCLNRKPHWHRRELYRKLDFYRLLDCGLVSMGGDHGQALRTLSLDCDADMVAPNSEIDHYGIPNSVCGLGHPRNWHRHFLNIVTETFYDINRAYFVTEKTYKPIVGERPFLIYDPDGGTRWLIDRGFEPYVDDFKDISDRDLRDPSQVAPFLVELCDQPRSYWRDKYLALRPKIAYNKDRFGVYVKEQYQRIERGIQCQI